MFEYKEKLLNDEHFMFLLNEEGKEGWQVVSLESGHEVRGWTAHKVLFMRGIRNTEEKDDD